MTEDIPLAIPVDASPAERMKHAVARLGEAEVVERAKALLAGLNAGEGFLLWVGGHHAQGILDGAPPLYWPEVWGARAFLYVWDDSALPGIEAGLTNQAWRVREMCLKVVATRKLALANSVRPLLTDDTARVRAAAARALGEIGEASEGDAIRRLFRDPEIEVRRAAQLAHSRLSAR